MNNKLYVGNLAYSVTDEELSHQFSDFGQVSSAKVMIDRDTGRSKGFGFVEMATAEQAQAAINALNGKSLGGRALAVNVARPREERTDGGFRGARSGGGGYGGGNRGGGYGGGGYGGGRSSY
jgi:RNA recognition motif-containing protein